MLLLPSFPFRLVPRLPSAFMTRFILETAAFFSVFSLGWAFIPPLRGLSVSSLSPGYAVGSHSKSAASHVVSSHRLGMMAVPAIAEKRAVFGGGCFWCIEAVFKKLDGVRRVVSGYAGGTLENPTYRDVASGRSGHAEVVLVEYDPSIVTYEELLEVFWKSHDPTQGNRQGLDVGSEYRSIILCEDEEQLSLAQASKEAQQEKLNKEAVLGKVIGAVMGKKEGENVVNITTTVNMLPIFWEAEKVHQDYYAKNPLSPYCVMNVGTKLAKLRPDISRINRLSREREEAL